MVKNMVYGFSRHPDCRAHFEHAIHMDFSVLLGSNRSPPPYKHDGFDTKPSCFVFYRKFDNDMI